MFKSPIQENLDALISQLTQLVQQSIQTGVINWEEVRTVCFATLEMAEKLQKLDDTADILLTQLGKLKKDVLIDRFKDLEIKKDYLELLRLDEPLLKLFADLVPFLKKVSPERQKTWGCSAESFALPAQKREAWKPFVASKAYELSKTFFRETLLPEIFGYIEATENSEELKRVQQYICENLPEIERSVMSLEGHMHNLRVIILEPTLQQTISGSAAQPVGELVVSPGVKSPIHATAPAKPEPAAETPVVTSSLTALSKP